MQFVEAKDLAPLIPIEENETAFQYQFYLDNAYNDPGLHKGAVKADLNQLPFQFYRLMYKTNGAKWYIGFNVFQEGADIRYQSFFWRDKEPAQTRLKSEGDWKKASEVYDLDLSNPAEARVYIPNYDWLYMNAKPMDAHFDLREQDVEVTYLPAEYQVQIAHTSSVENDTDEENTRNPEVNYEYTQEAGTSVTDTTTYEIGASVSMEFKLNIPFVSTTWNVKLDFKYTTSHSTTATYSEKKTYTIKEIIEVVLPPRSTRYLSVIIYAANDVLAECLLKMQMSGHINGEILSGSFLTEMAEAMGAVNIIQTDDQSVVYTLEGAINADVVSKSEILISDTPPEIAGGQLLTTGRLLTAEPVAAETVSV